MTRIVMLENERFQLGYVSKRNGIREDELDVEGQNTTYIWYLQAYK